MTMFLSGFVYELLTLNPAYICLQLIVSDKTINGWASGISLNDLVKYFQRYGWFSLFSNEK